jgi:hypothetical protein
MKLAFQTKRRGHTLQSSKIPRRREIQDGDGDRATDLVSWPRDHAQKLETHLAEVKHQGEPKARTLKT